MIAIATLVVACSSASLAQAPGPDVKSITDTLGQVTLRVTDFSKLGPLVEGSVEDGITDFRSLTHSLADEEAARQQAAAAAAMRSAMGRATAVLQQKGQKVGTLRLHDGRV